MNKYFVVYYVKNEEGFAAPRVSVPGNRYERYYRYLSTARDAAKGDKCIEKLVVVEFDGLQYVDVHPIEEPKKETELELLNEINRLYTNEDTYAENYFEISNAIEELRSRLA